MGRPKDKRIIWDIIWLAILVLANLVFLYYLVSNLMEWGLL